MWTSSMAPVISAKTDSQMHYQEEKHGKPPDYVKVNTIAGGFEIVTFIIDFPKLWMSCVDSLKLLKSL